MLQKLAVSLVLLTGVLLLGACSTTPSVSDDMTTAQPAPRYIIAPGDGLEIFVRDNPTLTVSIPVRPDGRISIPLVQSIMAAGKTPDQLAAALEKQLGKYVRAPMVTVIVKNFVGAFKQQVRVVGQAVTPKAVPYRRGMTLLDVMIQVGGLTKFAAGNDAKIVRRLSDGAEKTMRVRLRSLMNGAIKDNVAMQPGDILIIPESLF